VGSKTSLNFQWVRVLIFAVQKNKRLQWVFLEGVAKYQWVMNHFVFIKIQYFMGNH
jgi:hypothetical protein